MVQTARADVSSSSEIRRCSRAQNATTKSARRRDRKARRRCRSDRRDAVDDRHVVLVDLDSGDQRANYRATFVPRDRLESVSDSLRELFDAPYDELQFSPLGENFFECSELVACASHAVAYAVAARLQLGHLDRTGLVAVHETLESALAMEEGAPLGLSLGDRPVTLIPRPSQSHSPEGAAMEKKPMTGWAMLLLVSGGSALTLRCSSSTVGTTTSTAGSSGAAGRTTATTSTTTGGAGGAAGEGSGGSAGTGANPGIPPADGGSTCSEETPAGTAMCGAGKSCHLASCGPPAQYACFTAGAASAGAACMSSSDCSAGLTCIRYSLTVSVCEKQCTLDRDCTSGRCAGFTTCSNAVMGRFCLRACSDVTAAGAAACGTGFKCDGACVGQTSTPVCIAAGTARSGPCMSSADCAAGYTCINRSLDGGVAGECMQLCRTAADCTAGMCTGNIACAGVASGSHFCL